ncbi:MAG: hypothetical protein LBK54_10315 [Propionibacteriaceae bacterium]|jgi:hypothetical protein|nr:hypothetical protein [Propionibacteriaceae bacterium]
MITPPDLELWLTAHLRARLKGLGRPVEVSNKEPKDYAACAPLVVVRCDGGPAVPPLQWDWQVGVNVLAGTGQHDKPARDLARIALAVLTDVPAILTAVGSPITAVEGAAGPTSVDDPQDVARAYFVVNYRVIGTW